MITCLICSWSSVCHLKSYDLPRYWIKTSEGVFSIRSFVSPKLQDGATMKPTTVPVHLRNARSTLHVNGWTQGFPVEHYTEYHTASTSLSSSKMHPGIMCSLGKWLTHNHLSNDVKGSPFERWASFIGPTSSPDDHMPIAGTFVGGVGVSMGTLTSLQLCLWHSNFLHSINMFHQLCNSYPSVTIEQVWVVDTS